MATAAFDVNVSVKQPQQELSRLNVLLTANRKNANLLKKQLVQIEEGGDAAAKVRKELEKQGKTVLDLEKEYADLIAEQAKLSAESTKLRKSLRDQTKEINTSKGSLTAYELEIKKLSATYRDLGEEQRNSIQGQELAKRIEDLRIVSNNASQKIGDFTKNIGNYENSVKKALNGTGLFSSTLDILINNVGANNIFSGFVDGTEDATDGLDGLKAGMRALLANPLVAFLALAAATLTTLFQAFKRTETGADTLAKVSGVLNGILSEAVGVVDSLVQGFIEFTNDPIKGVKDLGDSIVQNVTNRITGLIDLFGIAGTALSQLINRDFDGLTQTGNQLRTTLTQVATGLDEVQQSNIAESFRETTEEIEKNIKAFGELEVQRRAIFKQNLELEKSLQGLQTQEALLAQRAGDSTIALSEQLKANEDALKLREQIAAKSVELTNNELSLLNTEIALRQSNGEVIDDLLQQQVSALGNLAGAQRELLVATKESETERRQILSDTAEISLDVLIDNFQKTFDINSRSIENDRKTLEERQKLFDENETLSQQSFDKQIELLQQFATEKIDANALLNESDAVALQSQIQNLGLSEILTNRLLESLRDRKDIIADLKDLEEELAQARQQNALAQIESERDGELAKLLSDTTKNAEQIASERLTIEVNAERQITEQKLRQKDLTDSEIAALELELQENLRAIRENANNVSLQSQLKTIEQEKQARIKAAIEAAQVANGGANTDTDRAKIERDLRAEIERINLDSERRILNAKIAIGTIGDNDRLAKENELAQAEIDINKAKNEAIIADETQARGRIVGIAQAALQGINQTLGAIGQSQQQRLNREENAITERYATEIEAAEGNTERIVELEEERDAAIEAVQREQFERGKKLQIAQALISGAQGILSVLAAVPGPLDIASLGAARIVQIAATAATTAFQVGQISSQQFADGGQVGGVPTGKGGKITNRGNTSPTKKGDNVLAYVKTGEVILNERQQQKAKQLFGNDVFGKMGVPNFKVNPSTVLKGFPAYNTGGNVLGSTPQIISPNPQPDSGMTQSISALKQTFEVESQKTRDNLNSRIGGLETKMAEIQSENTLLRAKLDRANNRKSA